MTLRDLFSRHSLSAYIDAFEREHVALADLAHLSDDDLREGFGMVAFMDRKRFKAMVAELAGGSAAPASDPGATRIGAPAIDDGATRMGGRAALPQQLGSYRILGLIGAGGMGTVLRARHMEEGWAAQQGGDVAIKLIHPHIASAPEFRARFVSEAALGRKVQHSGLVPTWDVIVDGGSLGTVMGFVSGDPLSTRVRTGGLPVDDVLALLAPVGEALDHLHAQGIVHRDVKPANIVVRPDGRPVLLDLGIAKDSHAGESHTRTMTAKGTSAWMAPEQADAKNVDGAADRYAFGLMAYALLSGRMPWGEGTSEFRLVSMKLTGQLEPLASVRPDLPANVTAAVTKMLSVVPGDRYASCAGFVEAVRPAGPKRLTYAVEGVSFDMVVVPPCTFVMGSPEDEEGRGDDEMQHEVRLTCAYAIATTPVTQGLYELVMGSNPSAFSEGPDAPRRPVEMVSWFNAVMFCNALSRHAGLRPAYRIGDGAEPSVETFAGADGFRLPMEAEWECAARCASESFSYAGGDSACEVAWCREGRGHGTQVVGLKRPNRFGLYDMSGNVWEWCSDWFDVYPNTPASDPGGPQFGRYRVGRGGSWMQSPSGVRAAVRGGNVPQFRAATLGIRVARFVPTK